MKRHESGQSTVEYILLLLVIFTLSMGVYNGLGFKNLLGEDSPVFKKLREYAEFTYRHGGVIKRGDSDYTGTHDTYWVGGARTHFFSPQSFYPSTP
ncbi:MAG: hypothetical protein KAG61_09720 [Bacteriovoracaceae bacterium]|nr:hypothetical protein [Bacteriovoracaceae bacterium]